MQDATRIRTAVLLAAGIGSRLGALTQRMPKCLVPVDGVPVLGRLMHALRMQGITRLVIVAGYRWEQISDYARTHALGLEISMVINADYASTNNVYSLWLARDFIDEPFLLVESDLVFESSMLEPLMVPDRIAVSVPLPWMNGTTVSLDSQSRVERFAAQGVWHGVQQYKTVNVCSLSLASWHRVAQRMENFVMAGRLSEFYESVFAELVQEQRLSLQGVLCDSNAWYEIDTLEDLQAANRLCAEQTAAKPVAI